MRLSFVLPILVLFLAACGGGGQRDSAPVGRPVDRAYPAFDDADPHPWSGRTPERHAVHGLDVSRWQSAIDWPTARAAGISFAFIKATEGVEEIDPMFETHWAGAGRAGVPRAAYHFYYFCAPAAEQARWFIANVPRVGGGLPHVLDMEWNPHSPTCRLRPPGQEVRAQAETFLDILEAHYGVRPILYTTVDFWEQTGIGQLPRTRFWVRSVAAHPSERYPGTIWDFWQYTGTGYVPGVAGKVDINVFHGTLESWKTYPG